MAYSASLPIRDSRTSPNLANNTAVLVTGKGTADYAGGPKYLNVIGRLRAGRTVGRCSLATGRPAANTFPG